MNQETIAHALEKARYNETVQVTVNHQEDNQDDNNQSHALQQQVTTTLVPCLDKSQGGVQWNPLVVHDENEKEHRRRYLRTKKWMFPMLNDQLRNRLYEQAIQLATVDVVRRHATQGDGDDSILHCLDIGSGTGFLAMLSVAFLQQALHQDDSQSTRRFLVRSLEMSTAMADIAKETIQRNGAPFTELIELMEGHSCEVDPMNETIPPGGARFCTSELLESGLLGEGWLPAMRDAWNRHLHPDAIVVPQRARVYAQLVSSSSLRKYWGPHPETEVCMGSDDEKEEKRSLRLRISRGEESHYLLSGGESGGLHVHVHAEALWKDPDAKVLCEPMMVLEIDVSQSHLVPPASGQTKRHTVIPLASGEAHGVLVWWELDLYGDGEDRLTYSTQADKRNPWQDHWHQSLYCFTSTMPRTVVEGTPMTLVAQHNDSQMQFALEESNNDDDDDASDKFAAKKPSTMPPNCKRPRTEPSLSKNKETNNNKNTPSCYVSPDRAWQLNETGRLKLFETGIRRALSTLREKKETAIVLDVSDTSICGMMAALLGAEQVTCLASGSGTLPMTTAQIAQVANELPLISNPLTKEANHFQLVQCHPEQLQREHLRPTSTVTSVSNTVPPPANMVVAEPYYEVLEGWHLQEALNYFYILQNLRQRGVVDPQHAICLPAFASICVCAMYSPPLWSAYQACPDHLGDAVQLDHTALNECRSTHSLALPLWQYDWTALTEPIEVARIDYQTGRIVYPLPTQEKERQDVDNEPATKKDADAGGGFVTAPFLDSCQQHDCHGMVAWVDYGIPTNNTSEEGEGRPIMSFVSTKGRGYHQLIRFLEHPTATSDPMSEFQCKAVLGDVAGYPLEDHDFEFQVGTVAALREQNSLLNKRQS